MPTVEGQRGSRETSMKVEEQRKSQATSEKIENKYEGRQIGETIGETMRAKLEGDKSRETESGCGGIKEYKYL